MANDTHNAVEDLWGSGDEASDGAGDDMLQLPPDEPTTDPPSSSIVERTSSKRGAPSELPARRHIPSFQGAFSQPRVQGSVGYGDGLKRQRLDNVDFSRAGSGPVRSAAQLTLPLTSSSLAAANIDLSSLPALPDPLSTNYPDLPPDAARFLNSITEQGQSGTEGESEQDALARLSAALAESGHWPGLTTEATPAAPVQSPVPAATGRNLRRRGDIAVPTALRSRPQGDVASPAQVPVGEAIERRGSGDIFLPPRSQLLPVDERYSASPAGTPVVARSPFQTPVASQPTTPQITDNAVLPSTSRPTRGKGKGKAKAVVVEPPATDPDPDYKPSSSGGAGRRSKRKLPAKADLDKVPSYRRMKTAAAIAAESVPMSVEGSRERFDVATQAQAASDAWTQELKRATTPQAVTDLYRRTKQHTVLLRRMRDVLTGELVRLQIEESVLRNLRGLAKDHIERLLPVV